METDIADPCITPVRFLAWTRIRYDKTRYEFPLVLHFKDASARFMIPVQSTFSAREGVKH